MRRGRRPNFALIGVLIAAVLVVITGLAFTKRIPFTPRYELQGVFSSSNQIRKGAPVRIAGVDVGKVTGFDRGEGGKTTIVKFQVTSKGRPVHADATLSIKPRIFLEGGFYMQLRPGSPSAPELDDNAMIPLGQTRVPVQFNQILARFDTPTRDSVRNILGELSMGLEGGGAESLGASNRSLGPAFRDLALVAEAARGPRRHDLSGTIHSTSRITAALAARDIQLADLVTNLNRTSGALASRDVALAASVRELDNVMRAAPPALTALDRALPPAERFLTAVRPGLRIAPPILENTADLMLQLEALSRGTELPSLLRQTSPLLRTLPVFQPRLRRLLARVQPVTDCIEQRVLPVLNAKLDDGALSSGQPVYKDFLSAVVGLSSGSQSFDGNGAWIRYSAGAGPTSISTGAVPGLGQLVGAADQPILGSRPKWLGKLGTDVYRPDAKCTDQTAPDLTATASLADVLKGPRLDKRQKRGSVTQIERALRKAAKSR